MKRLILGAAMLLGLSGCLVPVTSSPTTLADLPKVTTQKTDLQGKDLTVTAESNQADRLEVTIEPTSGTGTTQTQVLKPTGDSAKFQNLKEGKYKVTLQPYKGLAKGNSQTFEIQVGNDGTKPTVRPATPVVDGTSVRLSLTGDNAKTSEIWVDNGSKQFPPAGTEATFTNLTSGSHTAHYVAVNGDQRSEETTMSFTVSQPNPAPSTSPNPSNLTQPITTYIDTSVIPSFSAALASNTTGLAVLTLNVNSSFSGQTFTMFTTNKSGVRASSSKTPSCNGSVCTLSWTLGRGDGQYWRALAVRRGSDENSSPLAVSFQDWTP